MAITVNHDITAQQNYGALHNELGFVGNIENELQLYDVQIQIAKEKATGYYIIWKGHRINISPKGSMDNWPTGWCDQTRYAYQELSDVREGREAVIRYDWRHDV